MPLCHKSCGNLCKKVQKIMLWKLCYTLFLKSISTHLALCANVHSHLQLTLSKKGLAQQMDIFFNEMKSIKKLKNENKHKKTSSRPNLGLGKSHINWLSIHLVQIYSPSLNFVLSEFLLNTYFHCTSWINSH